jgi:hypothetical protein
VVDTHPETLSRALQRWGRARGGGCSHAYALAEMLRTGWYRAVDVKSQDSHRLKAMLGARDQLVRAKRALGNQVRGLLRPFGIRLPSRQGTMITCSTRA